MAHLRVLSVGQCGYDHARITGLLKRALQAEVVRAKSHREALSALDQGGIDLVLVNRIGDSDGAPGLDLIRQIRGRGDLAQVPVMLVSNHEDAQAQAVALGAVPGFGKAELNSERATSRLRQAVVVPGAEATQ